MAGCWVYILRCADGRYYLGSTRLDDVETRVGQHNAGIHRGFTYKRRPVVLVYATHFTIITEAIAFERQVKGWSRAKKEALIEGRLEALPGLARRIPRSLETPSSFETPPLAAPQDEGLVVE